MNQIEQFVRESNAIEQIFRDPTNEEIAELKRFMALEKMTIGDLEKFVGIYQPGAVLRLMSGMDVRVGNYIAPRGGPWIYQSLESLLDWKEATPHRLHIAYEKLHPFTDCNGRSGRALWAWKRQSLDHGFLLNFYYDALEDYSEHSAEV